MVEQEITARLIATLAHISAHAERWRAWLDELSAALGGAAVLLTLRPPLAGDSGDIVATGITTDFIHSYATTYYARDPWVQRCAAHPPAMRFGYELVPRWELLRSEFYHEWMAPQELLPDLSIVGLILKRDAQPLSTFAAFRRRGSRTLRLEDIALLRRLLPHLQRAVRKTRANEP